MKKLISPLVALAMVLSLSLTVSAADPGTQNGGTHVWAAGSGFGDVTMAFSQSKLFLGAADNGATTETAGTAQSGSFTVTPGGTLPAGTRGATIGTITVTINGVTSVGANDLATALTEGGIYQLTEDVTLSNTLTISADTVLDLNGHSLKVSEGSATSVLTVNSGVSVTIKDSAGGGTVSGGSNTAIENNGSLTIQGGSFSSDYNGITNNADGTLTVNGGTVSGNTRGIYNYGTLTVNGGTVSGTTNSGIENSGTVEINGGTVEGETQDSIYNYTGCSVSITGGSFSSDPSSYVASGYTATENTETGYWVVEADAAPET